MKLPESASPDRSKGAEAASGEPPHALHIAVVDDNTWYREGLGRAGGLGANHEVVARATDADELAGMLGRLPGGRCEVVLLDLRILRGLAPDPVHGGTLPPMVTQGSPSVRLLLDAAQRQVAQRKLAEVPAILCYTQENSPRVHLSCLIAGAMGVVHKDDSLDQLGMAVDIVASGGCVVSAEVATLIGLLADQSKLDISEAQAQVLALAGHGYSRDRIATTLCISVSTVDKHLAAVRTTCGNELSYTDLADAFGFRDLAPPDPRIGAKTGQRQRLKELSRRIARRY